MSTSPRQKTRALPAPSWQAPGAARDRRGRILLASPVFAPRASVGARRWAGLARWLAEAELGLDVLTAPAPPDRHLEPGLRDALPAGTRIFEVPARPTLATRLETALWRRLRRSLRRPGRKGEGGGASPGASLPSYRDAATLRGGGLAEPRDALRAWWALQEYAAAWRWAADAARLGRALLGQEHRLIATSGPPHPVAELGVRLRRETGLPFLLDLRDPWALQPRLPADVASPLWVRLAERGEARAVAAASLVTVTSDLFRERMAERHPHAHLLTVTNGYDEPPLAPAPSAPRGGPFRIGFTGTLYLGRDPRPLFEAVARLARARGLGPDRLEVVLMGEVEEALGRATRSLAREAGVEAFVHLRPRGSHREAQALMASAHQLVVLPWGNDLAIPAKLFEYARHPAWVLVFAPHESGLARLLAGSDADRVAPDDPEAAAHALGRRLDLHARGERARPLGLDRRFARRHQAERLLRALAPLLEPGTHRDRPAA